MMPERMRYIEDHVQKIPICGCWVWDGACIGRGYGYFRRGGKLVYAHRESYEAYNGESVSGLVVRHKCDTPSCVNPQHLVSGTQKDNIADAVRRKRIATGVRNGHCKYSDSVIREVRDAEGTNGEIARRFGIDRKYVWAIRASKVRIMA